MKRIYLYWICQLLGWGIYILLILVMLVGFSHEPINPRALWLQPLIGLNLLFCSHLMWRHIKKQGWVHLTLAKLLPRLFILNLVAALVAQLLIHAQMVFLLDWLSYRPIEIREIPVYVFNVMLMFWLWCIVYFSLKYWEHYRNSEIEKWKLKAALREAELSALKAQINPHFMFNALNNIRALTREDAERARQMITCLSDLLRYAVDMSRQEQVPLAQELEIVEEYLRLESVQYEERLQYSISATPHALDLLIPPMSIQLLVENAIKHGISRLQKGGFVHVKVALMAQNLQIEVENSGQLVPASERKGVGLRLIQERLGHLYGEGATLHIRNSSSETVQACLQIPQPKNQPVVA